MDGEISHKNIQEHSLGWGLFCFRIFEEFGLNMRLGGGPSIKLSVGDKIFIKCILLLKIKNFLNKLQRHVVTCQHNYNVVSLLRLHLRYLINVYSFDKKNIVLLNCVRLICF